MRPGVVLQVARPVAQRSSTQNDDGAERSFWVGVPAAFFSHNSPFTHVVGTDVVVPPGFESTPLPVSPHASADTFDGLGKASIDTARASSRPRRKGGVNKDIPHTVTGGCVKARLPSLQLRGHQAPKRTSVRRYAATKEGYERTPAISCPSRTCPCPPRRVHIPLNQQPD